MFLWLCAMMTPNPMITSICHNFSSFHILAKYPLPGGYFAVHMKHTFLTPYRGKAPRSLSLGHFPTGGKPPDPLPWDISPNFSLPPKYLAYLKETEDISRQQQAGNGAVAVVYPMFNAAI